MKDLLIVIFWFSSFLAATAQLYPTHSGELIEHSRYTISYLGQHKQAEWVYYELTPAMINGPAKRSDDFRPDPLISSISASLADYAGSGYDRGHLCPAASMSIDQIAMSESFYLSNMSPQVPSFNRGAWKKLEEQVRDWALQDSFLYVVTGPVFLDNKAPIGSNYVTVPGYYFKALYAPKKEAMIAFVLPNEKIDEPLTSFAITIDSLQKLTYIDLFEPLEDSLEYALESSLEMNKWPLGAAISVSKKESTEKPSQTSQQCNGIAKSTGQRCKTSTSNPNGFCHAHQNQHVCDGIQCAGWTADGQRCKRKPTKGKGYCWQHDPEREL